MLLHKKLTIAKSQSSRLSYSEVVSLPLESILSKIFRYDADLSDSVVISDNKIHFFFLLMINVQICFIPFVRLSFSY